jgi:hypothetical protein
VLVVAVVVVVTPGTEDATVVAEFGVDDETVVVVTDGSKVVVVALGSVVVDISGGRFVRGASLVNSEGKHFPAEEAGGVPSISMIRCIITSLPAATG